MIPNARLYKGRSVGVSKEEHRRLGGAAKSAAVRNEPNAQVRQSVTNGPGPVKKETRRRSRL